MFITPEEVMEITPYEGITLEQVRQAQFVIELYVGHSEAEITSPRDKALLSSAVAAQTVYMMDNPDITFNQIKATTVSQGGRMTTFAGDEAPFIAPLAVLACKGLSWKKTRSVRVGSIWQHQAVNPRELWVRD